ncbi:Protein of unknown function [Jatrophihabitans endophyticus]|uniref:DUF3618 domain-containing protein n=1 Tax=Jatrophihabitans endophyticus TaxID=1206085 RepID=A0A1M5MCM9_9ACTN|nr:DUF3618 domain-containing protein [Jatrophihabitans endophyticus]SHG75016.1 Protein of unknown function [Jatrophihabitans endophyticus]
MPERSAEDIKRDIERSRADLATAVDKLAYRGNPKRIAENAKQSAKDRLATPQGQAVVAAVGALVLVLVVRRVRKR